MSKDYSELAEKAQQAVGGIKDPELRRVAFEKILDDLLSAGSSSLAKDKSLQKDKEQTKKTRKKISKVGSKKKGGGPQFYINELIDENYFKKPKTITEVREGLAERGHHIPLTHLSTPMQRLCQQKKLRRQKVVGTYKYSNW